MTTNPRSPIYKNKKKKKPKVPRINFENSDIVLKCFYFFDSGYFLIIFDFGW